MPEDTRPEDVWENLLFKDTRPADTGQAPAPGGTGQDPAPGGTGQEPARGNPPQDSGSATARLWTARQESAAARPGDTPRDSADDRSGGARHDAGATALAGTPDPTRAPDPTGAPDPVRAPDAAGAPRPARTPAPPAAPGPADTPDPAGGTPDPAGAPGPTGVPGLEGPRESTEVQAQAPVSAEAPTSAPASDSALARILTEVFSPAYLTVVLLAAVGVHAAVSTVRGLLYGVVAASAVGALATFVPTGVPRPELGARRQRRRSPRLAPVAIRVAIVLAAFLGLGLTGAPRALFTASVAVAASAGVASGITRWWAVSVQVAVATTFAVALALEFGWLLWLVLLLPGALSWARIVRGEHTRAQVIVGVAVGAGTAIAAFSVLG